MIAFDEARERILGACLQLDLVRVALADALGSVLASPVVSSVNVPPFDNSSMDGFAVRSADVPGELRVIGSLAAGDAPAFTVGAGEAVRIMTGAPVPAGTGEVVPVEMTTSSALGTTVIVNEARGPGSHIRRAGGDVPAGAELFGAGTVLTPAAIGSIATAGEGSVEVIRPPWVAVLSTGDELRQPGDPLAPGKIYDSNRAALLAAIAECGFGALDEGWVGDDEFALERAVAGALAVADAVVTSGGVSVGDYDHVKTVLRRMGAVDFWQVAMRPAKPLAFGLVSGKPVFGLPGNPVSALVSFEELVRPALRQMAGHRLLFRPEAEAVTDDHLSGKGDLLVFLRVIYDGPSARCRLAGGQDSNVLSALAAANAFALLPPGVDEIPAGGSVTVRLVRQPEDR